MPKQTFSGFPAAEQKLGLDLFARFESYQERKKQAEDAAVKANQRLAAKPWFDECEQGLQPEELNLVHRVHEGYLKVQQAALGGAQGQLSALSGEWTGIAAELQDHGDLVHAIRCFQSDNQMLPEVDTDLPSPETLAEGISAYEQIVAAELEATRALLQAHKPDLLQEYKFRRAKETVEFGGAGLEVGVAADDLLAARLVLRQLRNQVQPSVDAAN
ncbi:MAG: hypothetical protein K2W95_15210 [Candidatus Obscuribacterales bacterium]|nr:hypothetical protein [Candidatus Obscuribacterales bacterium]